MFSDRVGFRDLDIKGRKADLVKRLTKAKEEEGDGDEVITSFLSLMTCTDHLFRKKRKKRKRRRMLVQESKTMLPSCGI